MQKERIIESLLLCLLIVSCNNPESLSETESKSESNYISSVLFLNGSDLEFKLYSRGCVHEENQSVEISKNDYNQFVISYFKDKAKLLDKKVVDSSFEIYIKSFIYECDNLSKKSSSAGFALGTIETIQISDGLHIINVRTDQSQPRNPFEDLIHAIHSKIESK